MNDSNWEARIRADAKASKRLLADFFQAGAILDPKFTHLDQINIHQDNGPRKLAALEKAGRRIE